MESFRRIENVLSFHHKTSNAPLNVKTVLRLALLQRDDLSQVLRVWPSAYKLTRLRLNEFIECCDRPYDVAQRAATFAEKLKSGALSSITNTAPTPAARGLRMAVKPSRVVKSTPTKAPVLKMEQLLQLVAAKNAANKLAQEQLSSKRRAFFQSQIPAVTGVLQTLAQQSRSFSTAEIVRKVQGSIKSPLSEDEVTQVLSMIAEQMPAFCQMVDAGRVKCVHLISGAPAAPATVPASTS